MKRNLPIIAAALFGLCIATCNAFSQEITDVIEAAEAAKPGPPSQAVDATAAPDRGLTAFEQADAAKHGLTAEQYKAVHKRLDAIAAQVQANNEALKRYLEATENTDDAANARLLDKVSQPPIELIKPPTINWLSSLTENARTETRKTGKRGFIFFTMGKGCEACQEDEKRYFQDTRIVERLEADFVCVKVDASKIAPATLRRWGVRTVPDYRITDSDWSVPGEKIYRFLTPWQFHEALVAAGPPRMRNASSSTRYPTMYALYRTGHDDSQFVSAEPQAEATPLELDEQPTGWRPRTTVRYANYGSQGGYGSAGGYGGAQTVYYMSAPQSYGSQGGYGNAGGYGGAGSAGGGYGWGYSQQPMYAEPVYYSSPSIQCGPGGCYMTW
jgi:hypothetical protein